MKTNNLLINLSLADVAATGLDLGDNQEILLKRIEAQMFFIPELYKDIKA